MRSMGSLTGNIDPCQPYRMAISTIHPLSVEKLTALPHASGVFRFAEYPYEEGLPSLAISREPLEINCPDNQPKKLMSSLEDSTITQSLNPLKVPIEIDANVGLEATDNMLSMPTQPGIKGTVMLRERPRWLNSELIKEAQDHQYRSDRIHSRQFCGHK